MKVTALLVSHNGATWLPRVFEALAAATRRPQGFIAVDTASADTSLALLEAELPPQHIVALTTPAPYATAVATGLQRLPAPELDEWIWLLHDDARPAPDCLEQLMVAASHAGPEVAAVGPKLRSWPSSAHLEEVGVRITAAGRRDTGLEPGEFDQGQHDVPRRVMAVNTAGMLIRRAALEQVGLDPTLPISGLDLDFGWRLARAGWAVKTAPQAVMFHVGATKARLRRNGAPPRPRRDERIAGAHTLLVHTPLWSLPARIFTVVLASLVRIVGLLLLRAPSDAAEEFAALLRLAVQPHRILRARWRTRRLGAPAPRSFRRLMAPWWLPARQILDLLTDIGSNNLYQLQQRLTTYQQERGRSWPQLLVRHPATWALLAVVGGMAIVSAPLLGAGSLQGGSLLPAPDKVGQWWSLWGSGSHQLGLGSTAPGPPYTLVLATLGTLLLGATDLVVTVMVLGAVPLSFVTAWWFSRLLSTSNWTRTWAALSYAAAVVALGSWHQGRFGTLVFATLLPLVARAGVRWLRHNQTGPTERWRLALLVAITMMFVPAFWVVAVLGLIVLVPSSPRKMRELAPVALLPLLINLPWVLGVWRAPAAWLLEAGLPRTTFNAIQVTDYLFGRAGGVGAPAWISLGLTVAAGLATLRSDTRHLVLPVWKVTAVAGLLLAAGTLIAPVQLPGVELVVYPWFGWLVLLVQGAFIAIVALGAEGISSYLSSGSFGWRQPATGVGLLAALLLPIVAGVWLLTPGWSQPGELERSSPHALPQYLHELGTHTDAFGVLYFTHRQHRAMHYQVFRSGSIRLGEEAVLALTPINAEFAELVERLLTRAELTDVEELAAYGVSYVYAAPAVAKRVANALDAAPRLGGASAPQKGAHAWLVQVPASTDRLPEATHRLRVVWDAVAGLALVSTIVAALPARRRQ